MVRLVFYAILLILVARAMRLLLRGVREGLTGQPTQGGRVPQPGVQMVRDPVCGTFVVPDRSVTLSVGREQLHFCSVNCRDKYRARTA